MAARFADETDRGSVCPIEIEETESGGVQLRFTAVKFIMAADLALQNMPKNFIRLRFGFRKQSHYANLPHRETFADYKSGPMLEFQAGTNILRE